MTSFKIEKQILMEWSGGTIFTTNSNKYAKYILCVFTCYYKPKNVMKYSSEIGSGKIWYSTNEKKKNLLK